MTTRRQNRQDSFGICRPSPASDESVTLSTELADRWPMKQVMQAHGDREISVRDVLGVVADFDHFGGASLAVVTWELGIEKQHGARACEQARRGSRRKADALNEPAGCDPAW
jgi:hypothetical protein